MIRGSLRLRLLLAASASIAIALLLAGLALTAIFERQVRSRVERELGNHLLQLAGALQTAKDGGIGVARALADPRFARPLSGLYWKVDFAAPGSASALEPLRSRSLWDGDLTVAGPGGLPMEGPEGEPLIAVQRKISLKSDAGSRDLWLTAAVHEDEVSGPVGDFRQQIGWSLGLIGLALLAASGAQVAYGLSPLKVVRQRLAEVGSGEARRLEGVFPSEVAPLAAEFNGVLEAQETSLRRARRRAGDLAHGLKTPLTILGSIAREIGGKPAADIAEQVEVMRLHVERELARARLSSGRTRELTPLKPAADKMIAAMLRLPRGETLRWTADIPAAAAIAIEQGDLTELLGNLFDNARKWAKSAVTVAYDGRGLTIADDGPGVPADQLSRIRERGRRLDESKQGSGLGLSIVHDIAELYGLEVAYARSATGGLEVAVAFPAQFGHKPPA